MAIKFNLIFIIQSLADNERKTGNEIAQQIKLSCLKKGIEPIDELIDVKDKNSFFETINTITESIKYGVYPYLHFEMHGSPDGLSLSGGEFISWKELKEPIRKLNILSKNNLYISLATCYGANFLDLYKNEFDKPCPFYGYIGATEEVNAFDFEVSFTSFFQAMLTDDSVTSGIRALIATVQGNKGNYIFIDCELYYRELLKNWNNEFGSLEGKIRYKKFLYQKAKKEFPDIKKSNKEIKRELDRMILTKTDKYLVESKKIFLHLEKYGQ